MATPGLRERKNARTQAAIQRAAYELALEQGYERTTVDQIAERADVSPRTVYVRYKTKDAIVKRDPEEARTGFEQLLADAEGDLLERFRAVLHAGIRSDDEDELVDLRHRATYGDPYLREMLDRQIAAVVGVIRVQLVKELGLKKDDVRVPAFAGALAGLLDAVVERAATDRTPAKTERDIDAGLAFLRPGFEQLLDTPGRKPRRPR